MRRLCQAIRRRAERREFGSGFDLARSPQGAVLPEERHSTNAAMMSTMPATSNGLHVNTIIQQGTAFEDGTVVVRSPSAFSATMSGANGGHFNLPPPAGAARRATASGGAKSRG